jgi:steroid 5-alpha reductase family enzyme
MPGDSLQLFAVAAMFATVLMASVYVLSVRLSNAGIVDIAWAAGFAPIALLYAAAGYGLPQRRALIAVLVILWSLRLAVHLYRRVSALHPQEDHRYARLRADWGGQVRRKMFWFFQFQALLLVVLSLPFLWVAQNPAPRLRPVEYLGAVIWLIALIGEATAHAQLQRFRSDPGHRGQVCQAGLWRYSRHPNYFFEWLIWIAYFLLALAAPYGWAALYCPALMLYFLLRVTGVPLTEELSLQSKGTAYAEYQRRTSVFVPWFARKS